MAMTTRLCLMRLHAPFGKAAEDSTLKTYKGFLTHATTEADTSQRRLSGVHKSVTRSSMILKIYTLVHVESVLAAFSQDFSPVWLAYQ